jgi:hypothetical protein
MEVQESPVIAGSVGNIGAVVEHRDYRGVAHWRAKHHRYSTWEADRLAGMKRDPASVPRRSPPASAANTGGSAAGGSQRPASLPRTSSSADSSLDAPASHSP